MSLIGSAVLGHLGELAAAQDEARRAKRGVVGFRGMSPLTIRPCHGKGEMGEVAVVALRRASFFSLGAVHRTAAESLNPLAQSRPPPSNAGAT